MILSCLKIVYAQYPQHFTYDDENGLPSNEVYSIVQDHQGFIWIGTSVGLYKYDGVRYHYYNTASQKTNSAANLVISSSGKIYYMNFKHQVFVVEQDHVIELKHSMSKINNLLTDNLHQIWFTHDQGISVYNEKTKEWRTINDFGMENSLSTKCYSNSIKKNSGSLNFINTRGIGSIQNGEFQQLFTSDTLIVPGKYMIEPLENKTLLFHTDGQSIHEISGDEISTYQNKDLIKLIANRKITNLKTLSDGKIWICTYSGVIQYDPSNNNTQILFPNIAFSDVLLDREHNYWFTTLQEGVFRVPNMNYLVWNMTNENILNDKLTHLTSDGHYIYFSNVNGIIQRIEPMTREIFSYNIQLQSDIQHLSYLSEDSSITFYQGTNEYGLLENESTLLIPNKISSVKCTEKVDNEYFFGTSAGLIIYNPQNIWTGENTIKSWCREIKYREEDHSVLIASTDGLIKLNKTENKWQISDTLLPSVQISSFDISTDENLIYLLTFGGNVQVFKDQKHISTISLPEGIQSKILRYYKNNLYFATNKGVLVYDLKAKYFIHLNRLSGLASNNVQDLLIEKDQLWLATGKGLQAIPIPVQINESSAAVYLKNKDLINNSVVLEYGAPLIIDPEVSSYSSNGQYSYLYKINENEWIELPADIEQIEILNLPSGKFKIRIKAVDHLGRDSENEIIIQGNVYPPFWERWWFMLIIFLFVSMIIYYFVRRELNKQRKEMKRLNELNLAKLTAIRSQMNPHFMFNTLNSLQDLILKQDFKNTNYYLTKFASLMRMILHNSEVNYLQLSSEIKMIQMYLELEQLRFGDDFKFQLEIDDTCNIDQTEIPTMMIQPYLENAIKHGLLHKKGQKSLSIYFRCETTQLICTIEDNGIGRKKSAEINSRQNPDHQSFSSEANQYRAEILTKNSKKNHTIEIVDLENEGLPTGTKVILHIPIENFNS